MIFPGENLWNLQASPFRGMAATPERKRPEPSAPQDWVQLVWPQLQVRKIEKEEVTPRTDLT